MNSNIIRTDYVIEKAKILLSSEHFIHECFTDEDIEILKNNFDKWWGPKKVANWDVLSYYLSKYFHDKFDLWWDSEKFDWTLLSEYLVIYCHQHINKWWDSEKFNWESKEALMYLCENCNKYFNVWWDPNKFFTNLLNAIDVINYLVLYCYDYFDLWWPSFKKHMKYLSDTDISYFVFPKTCFKYFHVWWPELKKFFNMKNYLFIKNTINYCKDYFDEWWPVLEKKISQKGTSLELYDDIYEELIEKYPEKMKIFRDNKIKKELI